MSFEWNLPTVIALLVCVFFTLLDIYLVWKYWGRKKEEDEA